MTALLLAIALQAPLGDEVDSLRGRVRSLEIELAIMQERMAMQAEMESRESNLDMVDVVGAVVAVAGLLGGGKWAIGKVQS